MIIKGGQLVTVFWTDDSQMRGIVTRPFESDHALLFIRHNGKEHGINTRSKLFDFVRVESEDE